MKYKPIFRLDGPTDMEYEDADSVARALDATSDLVVVRICDGEGSEEQYLARMHDE